MSTQTPPLPAGLVLEPFRALRFTDDRRDAEALVPPYDELSSAEEQAFRQRSLHSLVRVTRPEGHGEDRYAAAAAQLRRWRAEGTLRRDALPALYAYGITGSDGTELRGLLGAVRLAPASAGIVLPHEDTMAGPVADRLALLTETETDLEPIYLVYDGRGLVDDLILAALAGPLLTDAATPDGARHRLAAITDPQALAAIAGELLPHRAMIADGHHRYATYLSHQQRHWSQGDGPGGWDAGLAFLVDAGRTAPTVRAIHRVLTELPLEPALDRVAAAARVRPLPAGGPASWLAALTSPTPSSSQAWPISSSDGPRYVFAAGSTAALVDRLDATALEAALPAARGPAWRGLDVAALHGYVMPELLGTPDTEATVRFEHSAERAINAARRLDGTAILLRPPTAATVLAVAVAGDRLPRKSTSFSPKPASGLVLRPLGC